MQPLHIEFRLASPIYVESEHPIHLDALLTYAASQELIEQGADNPWEECHEFLNETLDKTEGENWVWKASKLLMTPLATPQFTPMIRKCDPDAYYDEMYSEDNPDGIWVSRFLKGGVMSPANPLKFKINTSSGQRKSYYWLAAHQWVDKVEAYCVGDKEQIEDLLRKHIKFIGKMGRNGFGRIKEITVTPSENTEAWRMRVLPLEEDGMDGVEYAEVQECVRPEYWNALARVRAKEPIL